METEVAAGAAYGHWPLAVLNVAVFVFFAFSFFRPVTRTDWRAFGAFSAFIVALFAEMYGFPLTIFLLAPWLQSHWPGVEWLTHDAGHLLEMMFGWEANPHFGPFHLASFLLIGGGFWLISAAWPVLYRAEREGVLATQGPYARIRHPQYVGFVLVITGFLLQWPTLVTLAMYPILLVVYVRLARREEQVVMGRFGDEWRSWARRVPAFLPRPLGRPWHPEVSAR